MDKRLLALSVGVVISTLDSSVLNVALPSMAGDLHVSAASVQWAASLYLVGAGLAFLPVAALGSRLGSARVYRTSLLLFAFISLLLLFSSSLHQVLLLRFVQGLAGAGIVGLVPGMVSSAFADRRGWALGMVASAVALGTLIGPPLGGFFVGWAGWHSIFVLNLPVSFLGFLLARDLPDLKGHGLVAGLKRLSSKRFILGLLGTLLYFAQGFGVIIVIPFFLQGSGMTPAQVGLILLIPPLLLLPLGPLAGRFADRLGYGPMNLLGAAVLFTAVLVQGLTGLVWLGLVGLGLGRALFQGPNNAAVLSSAPVGTESAASGIFSISRVLGQSLGSLLAGAVWAASVPEGLGVAFLRVNLLFGAVIIASAALILLREREARRVALLEG